MNTNQVPLRFFEIDSDTMQPDFAFGDWLLWVPVNRWVGEYIYLCEGWAGSLYPAQFSSSFNRAKPIHETYYNKQYQRDRLWTRAEFERDVRGVVVAHLDVLHRSLLREAMGEFGELRAASGVSPNERAAGAGHIRADGLAIEAP
ncbi:MAG: hypothetical protein AB7F74_24765 [Parvibaculaceae bacterium]